MSELIRTERGWHGHFICAESCTFSRNTLLEYGDIRIVVSTIGAMLHYDYQTKPNSQRKFDSIGAFHRMYETMAFHAKWDDPYWDIDVLAEVSFQSNWCIDYISQESDRDANDMHEKVVAEISIRLVGGEKFEREVKRDESK